MTLTTRTAYAIPDLQFPFHHPGVVRLIVRIIEDVAPDDIIFMGDLWDLPMLRRPRFTQDKLREFKEHVDACHEQVIQPIVEASKESAALYFLEGNHEERLTRFRDKNKDKLADLLPTTNEEAFKLTDFHRATHFLPYHMQPLELAPSVHLLHGDTTYKGAGSSVLSQMAYVFGHVVVAHSHRLAIVAQNSVSGVRFGIEVGHGTIQHSVPGSKLTHDWHLSAGACFQYDRCGRLLDPSVLAVQTVDDQLVVRAAGKTYQLD